MTTAKMPHTRLHHKNRRLFAFILAMLTAMITVSSALVYAQQRDQLISGLQRETEADADLIGNLLTDSMLRNDYSEGLQLVTDWHAAHRNITQLEIILDNGASFYAYRNEVKSNASLSITRSYQYASRSLTLTVAHDSFEIRETLQNLGGNLIILSSFFIVLIGLTLWFVLFRWMIKPMEQEIATQTQELRAARDNLEQLVRKRTQSLTQEIDTRKKAEQALRKLARAVEQSPIVIFITDTDGTIEYVNPKFEEVTGYTQQEAIGKKPNLIKSPQTPKSVHEDLWSTILGGNQWHHEIQDRCKDGSEFWAKAIISPIWDADGVITHFVALHEDITETKFAKIAAEEARKSAELSSKAKTELLANMSHELRTPLNAIIGFSETMMQSVFGPLGSRQYEEYAGFIHSSGSHLLQLINDILDVSAVDAGKLVLKDEAVDVVDACEVALQMVRAKAMKEQVEVKGIQTANLPRLKADPLRLKQILINLIYNAVKFTPKGGTVSCDAYIDAHRDMVITVSDTGIGMTEEDLTKAMDKFGQVDSSLSRKYDGTGLGLPLTKGLVELHGGVMNITSKPNEGTVVSIHFPPERVIFSGGSDSQAH